MKVFIAVPTFETISPETFKSIYGLDRCGHWVVFDYVRGYDCATARNRIGRQAIAEGADYVLTVDSDQVLPSNALRLMLEEPVDVLAACCPHKPANGVWDGRINATKLGEYDYTDFYTVDDLERLKAAGVTREEVHGCGFGATMVRTEVFKRLEWPWSRFTEYESGYCLSEDLHFCGKCAEAGIRVHLDPRVMVGHIMKKVEGM